VVPSTGKSALIVVGMSSALYPTCVRILVVFSIFNIFGQCLQWCLQAFPLCSQVWVSC
jgi:hypothetical protein